MTCLVDNHLLISAKWSLTTQTNQILDKDACVTRVVLFTLGEGRIKESLRIFEMNIRNYRTYTCWKINTSIIL